MKFRMLLILLLGAVGLTLAAGEKQGESPSEVQKKAIEATRNLDYGALVKLSHGAQQETFQQYALVFAQFEKLADSDEKVRRKLDSISAALKNWQVELTGEKIDGDLAAVYYVSSGFPYAKGDYGMATLKNIGGEWKLITDSEYLKERAFAVETGKTRGDTPRQVVVKLCEAIGNRDINAIPGLYYGAEKVEALKITERFAMLSHAAKKGFPKAQRDLKKFMEETLPAKFEIRGEKIDGDLAVVDVIFENVSDPQYLKKIGGEWRIIGEATYDKEKAARKDH